MKTTISRSEGAALLRLQRRRRMVTVLELDRAIAAGTAELTRGNERVVRCTVERCGRLCGIGQARRLWIDGHAHGFVCQSCQWDQSLRQSSQ